mmetsp:Transcript_14237/g.38175  ORF Transcript_14237/g.38175 Transcript_14237/m.38175 type:complete len:153 (+) Transcript_14237:164-622(+)|eukprot:CAMPEP_0185830316 /NCGR_PEP_ID=MMETSP1353-20130828/761_1 /TAXON_ID=1077150 /ORGANISM="Erythrolobus australicus, Strain CCMP3124" /LENGTH=152 /DNA_ID=CAMNT_0028528201 /DNA_START=170 /DNA_END=628 /DNA_ORIENTATION=+
MAANPEVTALALLSVTSLVEFASAADICNSLNVCSNKLGWAVAVGVISFCIATAMLVLHIKAEDTADRFDKWVAIFLVIWWAAGVGSNTSSDFPGTLNTYYFSWASFFVALYYAIHSLWGNEGMVMPAIPAMKRSTEEKNEVANATAVETEV